MNKESFIQFYNQYIGDIYRFVYFRVNSQELAQDLSSESFLRLWQVISGNAGFGAALSSSAKSVQNPRALLYQIARNLIADFYRGQSKMDVVLASSLPEFIQLPDGDNLIEKISNQSEVDQIMLAVKKIRPEQQEAVLLRYVNEMEIKEIAQILGKSEGAVRVLIHRGLGELRRTVTNSRF